MSGRFDVAVLGGGIAGMATAGRLQAQGLSTVVIERHGNIGGCAGFFRTRGFAFDVGATTLVDFEAVGAGGELLDAMGLDVPLEPLPGYVAWLPDRTIRLHRDMARWREERASALGDSPQHRALFALLDELASVFWNAARRGLTLPIRSVRDLANVAACIPPRHWPLARYLDATLGDTLARFALAGDTVLVGLLGMLVEDTVHATVAEAPLVNAALGITIRGAGLCRARGGMRGFFSRFATRYRELGGVLQVGTRVERVLGEAGRYQVETSRGLVVASQVVSALPLEIASRVAPAEVDRALAPYLDRDRSRRGGALVMFLGVPEGEVSDHAWNHHQLLIESAPAGHRAVMISTHCELDEWRALSTDAYAEKKRALGERLLGYARRVYPRLGEQAIVRSLGTPRSYERYTGRPDGAVGGARLGVGNANQNAVPHDIGVPGFFLVGDGTWPGLGTVAACLASRDVAQRVRDAHHPSRATRRSA
jgi:phytoene dehydrogenase-like protein